MTESRVALVTGANRGIGREIARQLAVLRLRVILGSRDAVRGERVCKQLNAEALEVFDETLDVTCEESVGRAVSRIEQRWGRLDVLVNNAAISEDLDVPSLEVDLSLVERTFAVNFYGALRLCQHCVPLMRRHGYGRIVNVSSGRGSFAKLAAGQAGYRISKTALNALTRIMASEVSEENILINAMTPGWVRTRMGGIRAPRSVEEGADTAVWLATLPDDGPRGGFFKDREAFPW